MFLHESWPWCKGQSSVLTVAVDGTAKVGSHVGVITPIFSGLQGGGGGILFFFGGGRGEWMVFVPWEFFWVIYFHIFQMFSCVSSF